MEIQLSQGKVALIDDEDAPLILRHSWHALKPRNTWYARSSSGGVYMHRLIMGLPRLSVDHINGDGLDNRRGNLRLATAAQQAMNIRVKRHKHSKFKGVSVHVTRKQTRAGLHEYRRWVAQISVGPKKYAAYFQDEVAAASWYNEMARKHFGEFAKINALQEAV